jgi:hypothetical protein
MAGNDPMPEAPWRAGLHSARATLLPGLALIAAAAALVAAYHRVPQVRPAFDALAAFRTRGGFAFSSGAMLLFGGLVPFLVLQADRRTAQPWDRLPFIILFWAYKGLEVDVLYRLLARTLGTEPSGMVVAGKVCADQFLYNPCLTGPVSVLLYAWKDAGFAWAAPRADLRAGGWYRRRVLPTLFATWGVWIPGTACVYSLPLPLQLPVASLMTCFWAILFSHLTARQNLGK